jgi:putative chitinase
MIAPRWPSERLEEDLKVLNEWADKFGVSTPLRMAHFLGQCAHESGEFRYVEEIASGKAYEGRKDLGNIYKGDGMRFKGRGYIQITGRKNYQDYASSKFCVGNLMAHPEWLTKSPGRVKASLYFWWKNGLNALADKDDILAVTKRINGGYNGLAARKVYTNKAKGALGIKN